jgi:hypothetical protein
MAIDNNLRVDELNFDGIKTNFKRYLQAQDQFRDYNFDGSGISALLDLLAYNTYYNSFYLNMVASEAFLPTAQKRNSVVNLAKSLNYTPRSTTSATISGTLTLTAPAAPASILVPAYTEFSGTIDGKTYKFLNTVASTVSATNGVYSTTINLKEGKLITTRYTVNLNDADQRFLIQNTNVDTSTISVSVLNSISDSTSRTFATQENLVEINSTTKVYFLEEVEDGQFEIKFGDGTFGISLDNSNIVVISYLISSGSLANDIQTLSYASTISGVTAATFVASDPAIGGNDRETISQIKFNAPKAYEAQNRVVTTEDYQALLLKQSSVDSVVVWGGEDNDPPTYGRVFIAIKPSVGEVLTPTEKQNLINTIIKPKKILTVATEIVDPEYLYLLIDLEVKYESTNTNLSASALETIVKGIVTTYNTAEINQFSKYFRYSKLSRLVDVAERSILNSSMTIRISKEVSIQLGVETRYDIVFANAINNTTYGRPSTHPYGIGNKVTSNAFTYSGYTNCYLEENNGIMRIYQLVATQNIGIVNNAGTLDYDTGKIVLTSFAPSAFADGGNTLKLTAYPAEKDILPLRNQILSIRDADITASMVNDRSISLVNR